MKINLDFNNEKSIYIQIKENIIKAIAVGNLSINQSLPSVRNMAENIGVNLHTVNKSYNELKNEGYLHIDRRKGAVVADLPLKDNETKINEIKDRAHLLISEAYLSGMEKDEFIKMCLEYYDDCGVVKNDR